MTVRQNHPRLFLTPERLTLLKSRAAANAPKFKDLKLIADAALTPAVTGGSDVSIQNCGLLYQITGDPKYATKAIQLMEIMIAAPSGVITRDSGYDTRNLFPTLALGYDWCYDRLTDDQKQRICRRLEQWVEWTWPDTNPARAGAWAVNNPGNNYWIGFLSTWMVGLALLGDSPKASGFISLAQQKWQQVGRPYYDRYHKGGYPSEGTAYGKPGALLEVLAAHSTATDENLLDPATLAWVKEVAYCWMHVTAPSLRHIYPGGDQARISAAPTSEYDRLVGLLLLNFLTGPEAGYIKWWLDHITPSSMNAWKYYRWNEFLWYRDDVPALDYRRRIPTMHFAPGMGWVSVRSSWETSGTQVIHSCGPLKQDHNNFACNGVMIFRGEWLLGSAVLNSSSGLKKECIDNNAPVFGGRLQMVQRLPEVPKETMHIIKAEDGLEHSYIVGDATDAYAYYKPPGQARVLNSYVRHTVFLKPNYVVLIDVVDLIDKRVDKNFPLNFLREPQIRSSNSFEVTGGNKVFGTVFGPSGSQLLKVPNAELKAGVPICWRMETHLPPVSGTSLEYLVTVLELAPSGATKPAVVQVNSSGGVFEMIIGDLPFTIDTKKNEITMASFSELQSLLQQALAENSQLQTDFTALMAANNSLTTENIALTNSAATMTAQISTLTGQISALNGLKTENARLNALITQVKLLLSAPASGGPG
jgi:hypothetical protein